LRTETLTMALRVGALGTTEMAVSAAEGNARL
jgi:hypothetical protein